MLRIVLLHDPYRAATHNKGIMNGIDAVTIATGNDWRAVESGAHAYAARGGRYSSMSRYWIEKDVLHGELELPIAVELLVEVLKPILRLLQQGHCWVSKV